MYNPATAGKDGSTQAFFLYRNQWAGIDGAPETQAFTLDGRLKNHPLGLGLAVFNDINNVIGRTSFSLSTAYQMKLTDQQSLAFGISAQGIQNRIFFDRIRVDDDTDPNLLNSIDQKTAFEMNVGLNYSSKSFQLGFAADQVLQNEVTFENVSQFKALDYNFIRHYIANIQYEFNLNNSWSMEPMILARFIQGLPSQFDASMIVNYKDQLRLGGTYRNDIAMAYFIGFEMQRQVILGYTYEVPISDLSIFGSISHEFAIGWRFSQKDKTPPVSNPKNKSISRLEKENERQYQKIDELSQRNERNRLDLEQSKKKQDEQNNELKKLKEELKLYQSELDDLIHQSAVNPDSAGKDIDGPFYLIVGAFKTLAYSKEFQVLLRRDWQTETRMIQNNRKSFYLIYTKQFEDIDEALEALKSIKKSSIAKEIPGNPWVFRKRKKSDEK